MADQIFQKLLFSLGWSTINSLWQMGLIWLAFHIITSIPGFRDQIASRYRFALVSVSAGILWFIFSFYQSWTSPTSAHSFFFGIEWQQQLLNQVMSSASLIYLALLTMPLYRLFREWRAVRMLRTKGHQKAPVNYRSFVARHSQTFNIKAKVEVYLSSLVQSPVTLGVIRPLILLPIALPNSLTTEQAESILLHELSHIRRHDYLINISLCFVRTLFYFNPFMNLLIDSIERDREHACDRQVLDFGYDPLEYASALLSLSKSRETMCVAAVGNGALRSRIEKIIGHSGRHNWRKPWMISAAVLILLLNCVRLASHTTTKTAPETVANVFFSPLPQAFTAKPVRELRKTQSNPDLFASLTAVPAKTNLPASKEVVQEPEGPRLTAVGYDLNTLSQEEQDQVKTTVNDTREILSSIGWQKAETDMGELLTSTEKTMAKDYYQQRLDSAANWDKLEKQLTANYRNIDWDVVSDKIDRLKDQQSLGNMIGNYQTIADNIDLVITYGKSKSAELQKLTDLRAQIAERLKQMKSLRSRPIISL